MSDNVVQTPKVITTKISKMVIAAFDSEITLSKVPNERATDVGMMAAFKDQIIASLRME